MNLQDFTSNLQEQFANKGKRLLVNRYATEYHFFLYDKPTRKPNDWDRLEVIRISELEEWMRTETMPKKLEIYLCQ